MNKFVAISLLVIAIAVYASQYLSTLVNLFQSDISKHKLLTLSELQNYNGVDRSELYLSILGNVFDVSEGLKHYGPGEAYHIFIGRDASRNFVTGHFNENEASDDVVGFNDQELKSLNHWLQFYKKEYVEIGKLIGRYYNRNGKPTSYCKEIKKLIKGALKRQESEDFEKIKFPPCNVEWDVTRGTRVWCTKRSGGIQREWEGVPRRLYEPGSDSERCACINKENLSLQNLQEYIDCSPNSLSCFIKNEKK